MAVVALRVRQDLRFLFRPTPNSDHGVDGEIETTDGVSALGTGRLVAVQVKSGPSYFAEETDTGFVYRGDERHLHYWREHSLPVVLILVDAKENRAYWCSVDASAQTTGRGWKIVVPRSQVLDPSAAEPIRALANALADEAAARAGETFERVRDRFREGSRRDALAELQGLASAPSWRFATPSVQAAAYRSLALWSFLLDRDRSSADAFLLQARTADATSDERVVRATIALASGGTPDGSLSLLNGATDESAVHLRVSLLLLVGRVKEAESYLSENRECLSPCADLARLKALIALLNRELLRAQKEIETALALKPRWCGVRETAAVIAYFAALPESEIPRSTPLTPHPTPLYLVRHDHESLKSLAYAADTFGALADSQEDRTEALRLRLWHLAALSNHPDRLGEARQLACDWVAEPSLFGPLVPWAVTRALIENPDKLVDRAISLVPAGTDRPSGEAIPSVLAGVRLLLARNRFADARRLLLAHEAGLEREAPDDRHALLALLLAEEGDLDGANTEAEAIADSTERQEVSLELRRLRAAMTADWREFAEERLKAFQGGPYAGPLLEAARMHATNGDPAFVLSRAQELFKLNPNIETIHMICDCAWQAEAYRDCLSWISQWQSVSPVWTELLERVRLACLLHLDPLEAVSAANRLLQNYPSADNRLRAMLAFLRIGDLRALSLAARPLLAAPDVTAPTLLRATQMVLLDDPVLARSLWLKAVRLDIPDDAVAAAVSLGFQVGEERQLAPLMTRMQSLAGRERSGVTAMTFPELERMLEGRGSEIADSLRQYYDARLPLHVMAVALGWTLAEVFHLWPKDNSQESAGIRHRPLYVRSGELAPVERDMAGRALRLDVSGFFVAAQLDVLDAVEDTYLPIRVSHLLPSVLVEEQRRLELRQPLREAALERLLSLIDLRAVTELRSDVTKVEPIPSPEQNSELEQFLAQAGDCAVFVSLALPLTDGRARPLELPANVAARVLPLSKVLLSARRAAAISNSVLEAFGLGEGALGDDANLDAIPDELVLSRAAAEALAGGDGLGQLAGAATVALLPGTSEEVRAAVAWSQRRRKVSSWLEGLRERLRAGLESRRYTTVTGDVEERDRADALELNSLQDLLSFAPDVSDVVWVEDRMASWICPAVVGVWDVLLDLRKRGALSLDRFYELLHQLRAGDFRYLPLCTEEVLHRLAEARQRPEPDTNELMTISRWLAAVVSDSNRGDGQQGGPAELRVVLEAAGATVAAVSHVWGLHRDDHDRAMQHSAWLMTHLFTGALAVAACQRRTSMATVLRRALAVDAAQLYSGALQLTGGVRTESTAAAYVDWVTNRYLRAAFFITPGLAFDAGGEVASLMKPLEATPDGPGGAALLSRSLARLYLLLPEDVQRGWLAADPSFCDRNRIESNEVVRIGDKAFSSADFWAAVDRPIPDDAADPNPTLRIRFSEDDERLIVTHHGEPSEVDDPLLIRFCLGDARACGTWAIENASHLDLPRDERLANAERIGALATARERVRAANELRQRGAAHFYEDLGELLRNNDGVTESAFQLPAEALIAHLRLSLGTENAAAELLLDVGVEETIRRLITLPRQLPDSVVRALASSEDAHSILVRLSGGAASPLSLIQLAALALRIADDVPEAMDIGLGIAERVLAPTSIESLFPAFARLCAVADAWLSFDATAASLPISDRLQLSMSHAARLLDVIGSGSIGTAASFFGQITAVPREFLSRDPELFDHVLWFGNFSFGSFAVAGLCSLAQGAPAERLKDPRLRVLLEDALKRLQERSGNAEWTLDRSLLRGAEGTFLAGAAAEVIAGIGAALPEPVLPDAAKHVAVLAALDSGREDVANDWWKFIQALVSFHRIYDDAAAPLSELTDALCSGKDRGRLSDRDVVTCLAVLSLQVGALQEASLREKVSSIVFDVLAEFGDGRRNGAVLETDDIGGSFFEIGLCLSARHGDAAASAHEFADFVDSVARRWPVLGSYLGSRLVDVVWVLPPDQAASLWRVVLRARENVK